MEIRLLNKTILLDDDLDISDFRSWYVNSHGYVRCRKKRDLKDYFIHRLILGLEKGNKQLVDHINGNKLDNRRSNLRLVTSSQNCMNRASSKGKYKNVYWDNYHNNWFTVVKKDGKTYYGTRSKDKDIVMRDAIRLRKEVHGEFSELHR